MVHRRPSKTYRPAAYVSKRPVGESAYLIDTRRNNIHQLNAVGAVIWDQLARSQRIDHVIDVLHAAFADIERRVIERDVAALIHELLDAELIVRTP
jgi:hypothetical protein